MIVILLSQRIAGTKLYEKILLLNHFLQVNINHVKLNPKGKGSFKKEKNI